jgi:hypothetical protein
LGLAALPVLNVTDELLGAAQFVAWALLKKTATKVITDKFPSTILNGWLGIFVSREYHPNWNHPRIAIWMTLLHLVPQ